MILDPSTHSGLPAITEESNQPGTSSLDKDDTGPPKDPVTQSGRPKRNCRLPVRYRQDILPEQPRPVTRLQPDSTTSQPPRTTTVSSVVRDIINTIKNRFGIWHQYLYRPSYDPNGLVSSDDLMQTHITSDNNNRPVGSEEQSFCRNQTLSLLLDWQQSGNNLKSNQALNDLVNNVILHPDFRPEDLQGFDARQENQRRDEASKASSLFAGFERAEVSIDIPSGDRSVPSCQYSVQGLYYRKLIEVIQKFFADPQFGPQIHFSPFKTFHKSPTTGCEERVFSDIYDSDVLNEEHDKVQDAPLPPDDPECSRERVIAPLMLWSDSTHLTNFGVAKLWPVYIMLGNL